jgi:hypothetical protein
MTEQQKTARSRHRPRRRATVLRIVVLVWAAVAVVILSAILFAPRKDLPPPRSEITYAPAPGQWKQPELDPFSTQAPKALNVSVETADRIREHERTGTGKYRIFGYITDVTTGEGLYGAQLAASYVLTEDEKTNIEDLRQKAATGGDSEDGDEFLDTERDLKSKRVNGSSRQGGLYEIRVEKPGEYKLRVLMHGYLSVLGESVVVSEKDKEVQHDIALSPGARISGHVVEAGTSRPAPGIHVHTDRESQVAITNEDGEYTLSGLNPGDVSVSINLEGTPYHTTGKLPSERVTIAYDDEHVRDVDFEVEPAGIVWGFVLGPDREGVRGAEVMLLTSESIISQAINFGIQQKPPLHARSDGEGYYEMFGVPLEKEWRLGAADDDWATQLTDPFMLMAGASSVRIDIFVMPGSDVYGRVVDSERTPLPKIDVACFPSYSTFFSPLDSPPAFDEDNTNEDGTFLIENLPQGEYQLLAYSGEHKVSIIGEPISPDGYTDIHGVELVLESLDAGEFSVFGYVRDVQERPIPGAKVALMSMSAASLRPGELKAISDGRGYFEIPGVEPGLLVLNVKKEGYSPVTLSNVLLEEETIVTMDASSTVKGRVLVRETRKPPDYYTVRATPQLGDGAQTGGDFLRMAENMGSRGFSNEDGSFELELPPGAYTLEARSTKLTPGETDVTLVAGQLVDNVTILVSREGGSIAGRVRTKDGKSPSGALVRLNRSGSAGMITFASAIETMEQGGVRVGRDGQFEFENLGAGSYEVTATMQGYAQGRNGPIEVRHGQKVTGVTVEIGFGGSLEGYVVVGGELKSGAPVTLVGNGISKMTSTDNNGRYSIEGIPAGSYLGTAVPLDGVGLAGLFSPLHARIEIFEGRTTVHNFGEETGTSIVGICSPAPQFGTVGSAIVRLPGSANSMAGVNFTNPVSWFTGDSTTTNPVVSMSQVASDGFFKLDNVPQGTFQLEIYYAQGLEILSGGGRAGYSRPITISGEEIIDVHELNIETR